MARTKELTPTEEELAEMRSAPKGLGGFVHDIRDAVKTMPVAMHKIGVVFLFQWYAMFIYWQFLAVSLGETVFNATPEEGGPAWDQAIAWSGLQNAAYNFVSMVSALFLVGFARKIGAKRVHAIALGLGAGALIWLAQIHNQYLALVPMIGLGIFWASAVGSSLPDGRQHGSGQAHRRLHGHPQHDDRRADACLRRSRSAGSSPTCSTAKAPMR